MNSACPTCGAVYAVTPKDVGRKLRCKKCKTSLAVIDTGLVVDTPSASAPAMVATPADDFDTGGEVVATRGKKGRRASGPPGPGVGEVVARIGGLPTILFGLGTFLVIWFTFMEPIGQAANRRAEAGIDKLKLERDQKIKKLLPKGKKQDELNEDERKKFQDDSKKITDDYEKQMETAQDDVADTRISNQRSLWFDKYGQLFGFVFLAFGSIGYLRTEQPLVMKIVAAVVLGLMLLMIFSLAVGGCGAKSILPAGG
jgi:predicted Zn finger-like uncharacterized protein